MKYETMFIKTLVLTELKKKVEHLENSIQDCRRFACTLEGEHNFTAGDRVFADDELIGRVANVTKEVDIIKQVCLIKVILAEDVYKEEFLDIYEDTVMGFENSRHFEEI
jgi:hypothetical protein